MNEPLRPLSVGEVLDRTFSLYKKNFKLFVGVAILGPVAMLCAQITMLLTGLGARNPQEVVRGSAAIAVVAIAGSIFYMLGQSVSIAATTRAVAAVYLDKAITIKEAFRSVKGRVLKVIGIYFAIFLLCGLVGALAVGSSAAVFAMVPAVGRALALPAVVVLLRIVAGIVAIVFVVAAIAFALRYALAVQACVIEDLGVNASMTRSAVLAKGGRKRIFTVIFVCVVITWAFGALSGVLGVLLSLGAKIMVRRVVTEIVSFAVQALVAPVVTTALAVLYYDQRVRKEAFDLQFLMESLDGARPAEAPVEVASLS